MAEYVELQALLAVSGAGWIRLTSGEQIWDLFPLRVTVRAKAGVLHITASWPQRCKKRVKSRRGRRQRAKMVWVSERKQHVHRLRYEIHRNSEVALGLGGQALAEKIVAWVLSLNRLVASNG